MTISTMIDRDRSEAIATAVDAAFTEGLGSRYGGGITAVVTNANGAVIETVIRPASPGLENLLVLGLVFKQSAAPAGTGLIGSGIPTVPLGTVAISDGPERHAGDIHVETELFDDGDPNAAGDAGSLPTGLLIGRSADGEASGLVVLRSVVAIEAAGIGAAQGVRGWLPRQRRGRVNRSAGLGSNGFRRAAIPALLQPAAQVLLGRVGDRVAQAPGVGSELERLALGFRVGPAGTQ